MNYKIGDRLRIVSEQALLTNLKNRCAPEFMIPLYLEFYKEHFGKYVIINLITANVDVYTLYGYREEDADKNTFFICSYVIDTTLPKQREFDFE